MSTFVCQWYFHLAAIKFFIYYIHLVLGVLCVYSMLIVLCTKRISFWSSLFGVLYASYTLTGMFLFRLLDFSSFLLLKIFSVTLTWVSSLSSLPITCTFGFSIVSQISGYFVPRFFRFSIFLDQDTHFFYYVFNVEILTSFTSFWLGWPLRFLLSSYNFHFQFYLLILFPLSYLELFLHLVVSLFFLIFSTLIHIFFQNI